MSLYLPLPTFQLSPALFVLPPEEGAPSTLDFTPFPGGPLIFHTAPGLWAGPGPSCLPSVLPHPLCPAGIVCLVVTIMYWSGWEMGAVEAISLSILVGSSVDYCVHLVEGYLLAGENLPPLPAEVSTLPALPLPTDLLPPR